MSPLCEKRGRKEEKEEEEKEEGREGESNQSAGQEKSHDSEFGCSGTDKFPYFTIKNSKLLTKVLSELATAALQKKEERSI